MLRCEIKYKLIKLSIDVMKTLKKIFAIAFFIIAAVLACGGVTAVVGIPLGACAYFLLKDAGVDID